jgi:hypothetical protein
VWRDARNKANAGDKFMSTEEIVYKVHAMKYVVSLHTHDNANKKQTRFWWSLLPERKEICMEFIVRGHKKDLR